MWPNPQFSTDLVTFSEEILNAKLLFGGQYKLTFLLEIGPIKFEFNFLWWTFPKWLENEIVEHFWAYILRFP